MLGSTFIWGPAVARRMASSILISEIYMGYDEITQLQVTRHFQVCEMEFFGVVTRHRSPYVHDSS